MEKLKWMLCFCYVTSGQRLKIRHMIGFLVTDWPKHICRNSNVSHYCGPSSWNDETSLTPPTWDSDPALLEHSCLNFTVKVWPQKLAPLLSCLRSSWSPWSPASLMRKQLRFRFWVLWQWYCFDGVKATNLSHVQSP